MTPNNEVAAAAVAMRTLQEYFIYAVGFICGILQVTLEVTAEDWGLFRVKIERLADFHDRTDVMLWTTL